MKTCMKKSNQERFSNLFSYYIDGTKSIHESKRYTTVKKPFKNNVIQKNSCTSLCLAQPECLENNAGCKATYEPNSDCYCQFQKVNESFSTIKDFLNLENTPVWSYAISETKMTPINDNRVNLNTLNLINDAKTNYDHLSASFWVYLKNYPNANLNKTLLLPLLEIVDDNKKSILSVYIFSWNTDQTIVVRHRESGIFDAYATPDSLNKPFHLVITFNSLNINNTESMKISGYKVYKNGVLLSSIAEQSSSTFHPDDSSLPAGNLILNRNGNTPGVDTIYIQNLYLYNSTLSQVDVNVLYNSNKQHRVDCIFNANDYSNMYPDLQQAFHGDIDQLKNHYLNQGVSIEKRTPCGNINPTCSFDAATYSSYYPDLQQAFHGDVAKLTEHYKRYGINEGRIVCKAT